MDTEEVEVRDGIKIPKLKEGQLKDANQEEKRLKVELQMVIKEEKDNG